MFIRDDQNYAWTFDNGRIFAIKDEIEGRLQAGFACGSWEEGIAILNKNGYISGITENFVDPLP
jgi:hypothetical protein